MKSRYTTILILLLLSMLLVTTEMTAGSDFLTLPVSTVSVSLSESLVTSRQSSDFIQYNPAGIVMLTNKQFTFSDIFFGNDLSLANLNFVFSGGKHHFGIGMIYFHVPAFSDGSTGTVSIFDLSFMTTFGMRISGLETGITFKYIYNYLAGYSASAYALDFGVMKRLSLPNLSSDNKRNLCFGLSTRNIGTKIKFIQSEDHLPASVLFSSGYEFIIPLIMEFNLERQLYADETSYKFGIQYSIRENLFLRAGDKIENGNNSFSAGIGVQYMGMTINYGTVWHPESDTIYALSIKIIF